jgi:dipeptidyl aminopeptidase/acylaminoacyl peptidase
VEKPGIPVYDAASRTWYASANGCLVELRPDGRLAVLLHGVQGVDVDVRASQAVAVSREPDHTIVLHRWAGAPVRRVLLRGDRFHAPRLSPDGQQVLVQESRAGGGHLWWVTVDGRAVDLGEGSGASWHPDGRRVIYSRVKGDGYRVTAADLFLLDLATRRTVCLGRTPAVAEVNPVVSPDGKRVAFLDARSGELYVAGFPDGRR